MNPFPCQSCGGSLSKIGLALYRCEHRETLHYPEKAAMNMLAARQAVLERHPGMRKKRGKNCWRRSLSLQRSSRPTSSFYPRVEGIVPKEEIR
jgi:hypothetical protein